MHLVPSVMLWGQILVIAPHVTFLTYQYMVKTSFWKVMCSLFDSIRGAMVSKPEHYQGCSYEEV